MPLLSTRHPQRKIVGVLAIEGDGQCPVQVVDKICTNDAFGQSGISARRRDHVSSSTHLRAGIPSLIDRGIAKCRIQKQNLISERHRGAGKVLGDGTEPTCHLARQVG